MKVKNLEKLTKKLVSAAMVMALVVTMLPIHAAAANRKDQELTYGLEKVTKEYKTEKGILYKTISYQYPVFKGESATVDVLNSYFEKQKDQWVKAEEKTLEEAKKAVEEAREYDPESETYYSNQVDCKVFLKGTDYVSVIQDGYDYTMGAHGLPYRYCGVFSQETGKKLTASAIIKKSASSLNTKVKKAFIAKYESTKNKSSFQFYPSLKEVKAALSPLNFNKQVLGSNGFYLKNNRIVFYTDPYVAGPYAGGYIEISFKINK